MNFSEVRHWCRVRSAEAWGTVGMLGHPKEDHKSSPTKTLANHFFMKQLSLCSGVLWCWTMFELLNFSERKLHFSIYSIKKHVKLYGGSIVLQQFEQVLHIRRPKSLDPHEFLLRWNATFFFLFLIQEGLRTKNLRSNWTCSHVCDRTCQTDFPAKFNSILDKHPIKHANGTKMFYHFRETGSKHESRGTGHPKTVNSEETCNGMPIPEE